MRKFFAYAVALLLVGWGTGTLAEEVASARDALPAERLGTANFSTDVWQLVCPAGTFKAMADVNDVSEDGATLSVSLLKAATGRTITRHAPDGEISPLAANKSGPGTYFVLVHKHGSTRTSVDYDSLQDCLDVYNNPLSPSSHTLVQNQ